jgi:hypothetical protein
MEDINIPSIFILSEGHSVGQAKVFCDRQHLVDSLLHVVAVYNGSKIYPGSSSVVQALVAAEDVGPLLRDLKDFQESETSHRHLTAWVLPVETQLM